MRLSKALLAITAPSLLLTAHATAAELSAALLLLAATALRSPTTLLLLLLLLLTPWSRYKLLPLRAR